MTQIEAKIEALRQVYGEPRWYKYARRGVMAVAGVIMTLLILWLIGAARAGAVAQIVCLDFGFPSYRVTYRLDIYCVGSILDRVQRVR